MEEPTILYEVRDQIAYITFNRPERYNATSHREYELLYNLLKKAHEDEDVRAAILSGKGKHFSVSDDLNGLETKETTWSNRVYGYWANQAWADYVIDGEIRSPAHSMMKLIAESGTVFICCSHGLNYMPEITYWFDYVVAGESALFCSADLLINQSTAGGLSIMLPRIAGRRVALETYLDLTPFSGEEAFRRGLVNKVVPDDQMIATAEAFARKVLPYNAKAIAMFKKCLTRSQGPIEEMITMEQMYAGFLHALPGTGQPTGENWVDLIKYPKELLPSADLSVKYLHQKEDREK